MADLFGPGFDSLQLHLFKRNQAVPFFMNCAGDNGNEYPIIEIQTTAEILGLNFFPLFVIAFPFIATTCFLSRLPLQKKS